MTCFLYLLLVVSNIISVLMSQPLSNTKWCSWLEIKSHPAHCMFLMYSQFTHFHSGSSRTEHSWATAKVLVYGSNFSFCFDEKKRKACSTLHLLHLVWISVFPFKLEPETLSCCSQHRVHHAECCCRCGERSFPRREADAKWQMKSLNSSCKTFLRPSLNHSEKCVQCTCLLVY